jgi:flagellar biogenesis protein FliO
VAGVSKVGGGNNMDTIEAIYFGQNRGAVLIRVADVVYLLGHTPENIVLLEKIEGDKAVELIASSSKSGSTVMSFKDAFNNFMGKMKR